MIKYYRDIVWAVVYKSNFLLQKGIIYSEKMNVHSDLAVFVTGFFAMFTGYIK